MKFELYMLTMSELNLIELILFEVRFWTHLEAT